MKAREFFNRLRMYPDLNVDILVENKETKMLEDIADIVVDERNGNLIIVQGYRPMTGWELYIEYLKSWADSHSDNVCMYQTPASYDEWLDNENEE